MLDDDSGTTGPDKYCEGAAKEVTDCTDHDTLPVCGGEKEAY